MTPVLLAASSGPAGWQALFEALKSLAQILGLVGIALGLPSLLLYAVKERRKNRAADLVAEGTVGADIAIKDTAADDARLLHAIAAFDAERASLQRQLADRDREIERQRGEITYRDRLLEHRDEQIEQLRQHVDELLTRLTEVTREAHAVKLQLAELSTGNATTSPEESH